MLFYLLFLIILGLPIMTMEFAVGRASQKSPVKAYHALEKPGQKSAYPRDYHIDRLLSSYIFWQMPASLTSFPV